jgi:ankyrin repeat protein
LSSVVLILAVSSAGTFNKASVDQLEYIVNKLGGNCQLIDSKGSNAFHYLASNPIDEAAAAAAAAAAAGSDAASSNHSSVEQQSKYRNRLAEILLKSGCDANAENSEFETPFVTAVAHANLSFARYLLEQVDIRVTARQSPNGKTLLSLLAEKCVDLDLSDLILNNENHLKKNIE